MTNSLLSDISSLETRAEDVHKRLKKLNKGISNLLDLAKMHPSPDLLNRLQQRERDMARSSYLAYKIRFLSSLFGLIKS